MEGGREGGRDGSRREVAEKRKTMGLEKKVTDDETAAEITAKKIRARFLSKDFLAHKPKQTKKISRRRRKKRSHNTNNPLTTATVPSRRCRPPLPHRPRRGTRRIATPTRARDPRRRPIVTAAPAAAATTRTRIVIARKTRRSIAVAVAVVSAVAAAAVTATASATSTATNIGAVVVDRLAAAADPHRETGRTKRNERVSAEGSRTA